MNGKKCVVNCVPPALSTEKNPSETAERERGAGAGWYRCAGMVQTNDDGQHDTRRDDESERREGNRRRKEQILRTYFFV